MKRALPMLLLVLVGSGLIPRRRLAPRRGRTDGRSPARVAGRPPDGVGYGTWPRARVRTSPSNPPAASSTTCSR
jgi:hypothetical protein